MKQILYSVIAGAVTCVVLLHSSFARPADQRLSSSPVQTNPCQDCGTVFSFDPATASEKVLHSFQDNGVDGWSPNRGLILFRGNLYGTTISGGAGKSCGGGCGAIYLIDLKTGAERVVYSFLGGADGSLPTAGLHVVGDLLYGITYGGGNGNAGTVFVFDPATQMETVVYSFQQNGQDGEGPEASLIDAGGVLYGTTGGGGAYGGGTVFSVNLSTGAEAVLHSFGNGEDGQGPYTGVTSVGDVLYGTTYSGGARNAGTVFSLNLTSGAETIVHSFTDGDDGAGPYGELVPVSGKLYGTTVDDDTCNDNGTGQGSVYAIDVANGAEINLHCFSIDVRGGGLEPFGKLAMNKGVFYGTTQGGGSNGFGTIFSMRKSGGTKSLYTFCSQANCPDGAYPQGGMIDIDGTLYGVTTDGGAGGAPHAEHGNGEAPQ